MKRHVVEASLVTCPPGNTNMNTRAEPFNAQMNQPLRSFKVF